MHPKPKEGHNLSFFEESIIDETYEDADEDPRLYRAPKTQQEHFDFYCPDLGIVSPKLCEGDVCRLKNTGKCPKQKEARM